MYSSLAALTADYKHNLQVITSFYAAIRGSARVRTTSCGSDKVRSRVHAVSVVKKIPRWVLSYGSKRVLRPRGGCVREGRGVPGWCQVERVEQPHASQRRHASRVQTIPWLELSPSPALCPANQNVTYITMPCIPERHSHKRLQHASPSTANKLMSPISHHHVA